MGRVLIWADLAQSLCSSVSGDGWTLIAGIKARAPFLADDVYVDDGLSLQSQTILTKKRLISKCIKPDPEYCLERVPPLNKNGGGL